MNYCGEVSLANGTVAVNDYNDWVTTVAAKRYHVTL